MPSILCLAVAFALAGIGTAGAVSPETMNSVVSVLPHWPGRPQGGPGAPPGASPEGSGIALRPSVIATAWHIVERAERIEVRLADGRMLPASLIARDPLSDIALLRVDASLAPFDSASDSVLADPVCAIGNSFGLGLSVTCGVVSAIQVSNAGFNAVEDFVQTDAAINPGASGGALVDRQGRLVGMVSAIFASKGDTSTGVGFAVSAELLWRVAEALLADGKASYPSPGWRLEVPRRNQLARLAAPVVTALRVGGPAEEAGVRKGDLVAAVGERRTRSPRDAISALAVLPESDRTVELTILRGNSELKIALPLRSGTIVESGAVSPQASHGDCPHPPAVCIMRQAVFPVSSFDPMASATRIASTLLVTNRHVVGNRTDGMVHTPDGPRRAEVVASDYLGDLVLLSVNGLPEGGHVPTLNDDAVGATQLYVVGADVSRQEVRVLDPGTLIAKPAKGAELGRIHVTARMQPGFSGGALVDENGNLVGIAVGGGEGRYEAIPLAQVAKLLDGRNSDAAPELTEWLGRAFANCANQIDAAESGAKVEPQTVVDICSTAFNQGQLLEAGRMLARSGAFDGAAALHGQAVRQTPNSINARLSLLASMQLSARFEEMIEHAQWLIGMTPDDPRALRIAIQSGVWGDVPELAEEAYRLLLDADPRQARAARRFIDSAPPAPLPRN
ncbi:MAG: trypsin-like serine protease [Boseongicola sp. SB0673_bin_14]|nr:trypsin-like serine protease [Boseongicola sp. SB0673_bin_14]